MMRALRLVVGSWRPRIDGRTLVYRAGDVVEVEDSVAEWLVGSGAAVDPAVVPDPVPVELVEPEPEPEGEDVVVVEGVEPAGPKRPRNAARVEDWEAYAKSRGVSTKGMTKREMIAAVG